MGRSRAADRRSVFQQKVKDARARCEALGFTLDYSHVNQGWVIADGNSLLGVKNTIDQVGAWILERENGNN